jgi:hypothetical protein
MLTSAQWPSSVKRLALADMRRGELVDGERPEVEQRGAPPLHTRGAVRLGLLALVTTRAHPPATLEQHKPGEHTVALPSVTTTPCPQIFALGRQALQGRPCARNVWSCLQSPMPLRSLDGALLCILSCVLHGPLARIGQYIATHACDAAQPAATTRSCTRLLQLGERTHRALVS